MAVTRRLVLAVGTVLVLGVLVRLHSRSPLWLDEALSVNIATLPLSELPAALRQDGAPPLFYVLLHGWTRVFGTGDLAVRALPQLFGLLALPLAFLAGRRLHSREVGWVALLLLASNPFAVHYASETRMYSLVVVEVLLGVLALAAALRDPTPVRLAGVTLVAAALALTHYWALFLLAVVGAGLLVASVRSQGPERTAVRRCLAALVASGVLFLPWLPTFLFQSAHTGTPWAVPPGLGSAVTTWQGWGGAGLPGVLLGLLLLALAVAAVLARPAAGPGGRAAVLLALPAERRGLLLLGTAQATLLLGVGLAAVQSSGYALRYSSVVLAVGLLAAALGAAALPTRLRVGVVAVAVLLGLASSLPEPLLRDRTQAGVVAGALADELGPGDLVVYCPDQLGPAVDRLLPDGVDQVVYPTGAGPERIDWVDYADRNRAGDPQEFAAEASRRARGAVFLVWAEDYRTFGTQCERLDRALAAERGDRQVLVQAAKTDYDEESELVRYP